jgi:DNA-directed RNA polymerase specialized sigma54-like protein
MKTLKQLNESATKVAMVEEIDAINDTGYLTEDLVSIVETAQKNVWSESLDADAFEVHLEKLRQEALNGK